MARKQDDGALRQHARKYWLCGTLRQRLRPLVPGLTPRPALEIMSALQMVDVRVPTTDGRLVILMPRSQNKISGCCSASSAFVCSLNRPPGSFCRAPNRSRRRPACSEGLSKPQT